MRFPEQVGFSASTEAEFDRTCIEAAGLLASVGSEDADFMVDTHSGTGCSVDIFLKNYERFTPEAVEALLPELQGVLRKKLQYWCLRIWVYRPGRPSGEDDMCIWLEIDRYAVYPYRGKKEMELFGTMEQFLCHFWGRGTTYSTDKS